MTKKSHNITSQMAGNGAAYPSLKKDAPEGVLFLYLTSKSALVFRFLLFIFLLSASGCLHARPGILPFADSLRQRHHMPALAYAVISADSVLEENICGVTQAGTGRKAQLTDLFRLGSNTKAITAYLAATLVHEKQLSWDTRFFGLFPELKNGSNKAYRDVSLIGLLSFRAKLPAYTYTWDEPHKGQFSGDEAHQRYELAQWFFAQQPVIHKNGIACSNLGYVAAALMMEKATGQSYQQLVSHLLKTCNARCAFGPPNSRDTTQPWRHNSQLLPEPPGDNYKLNWLEAAGNISMSLPDYIQFIQLDLAGLSGKNSSLPQADVELLHYGCPTFALGWFWEDRKGSRVSWNLGNPGTFLSKVIVYQHSRKAIIVFSNVQSEDAEKGIDLLVEKLQQVYGIN